MVQTVSTFTLDLHKIAKNVKQNNDVYQTTADYLLFTSDSAFSGITNILGIIWQAILIVYIVVSICLLIFIFIRQRKLIFSLALLAHTTPTENTSKSAQSPPISRLYFFSNIISHPFLLPRL